jgi:outer membrane protein OmpA-like peptidoglycan-associated protein
VRESPRRSGGDWVLVLLAMAGGLGLGGLGFAGGAEAQSVPQFDLNQFRPSELSSDGFAVSNADGQGHLRFGVQVYLDFSRDPMELQVTNGPIPDQRLPIVHSQLTGHLSWSLGLWERLVVFMDVPYTFILGDQLSDEGAAFLESIGLGPLIPRGRGLGDLYLGARGVLYGTREDLFQLAAQATLTTNTASASRPEQNYLGEPSKSPNIGGWFEVLGTFNAGEYVRVPLNLGYKTGFRQDVPSLSVGSQLTFGAAVQVLLGQERFMVTMEAFGRTAAESGTGFGGRQETPVELLGGFKFLHPKGFAVGIAGTGGVTSGYGNPDWRLIGMLAYTMPEKKKAAVVPADEEDVVDAPVTAPVEREPVEDEAELETPAVVIEDGRLEIVDKLYFNSDSAQLQRRSYAVLDRVAEALNAHRDVPITRVEGHTDWTGSSGYNMRLSQRRAEAVVRYLVDEGEVSRERLIAVGFGESQPLVPNARTKMELAKNRRVEFHLIERGADDGGESVNGR